MILGAPWNWYSTDSKFALELLASYAAKVERQIIVDLRDYTDNKQTDLLVEDEDLGIGQMIDHYDGLTSLVWDMDEVHNYYFPNLQRKAAFITMYAFLEHELEKLANKLKRRLSLAPEINDMAGNGIVRSLKYMKLVASLEIDPSATEWHKISEINQLRNLIMHNDGKLRDHGGTKKKEAKVLDQLSKYLSERDNEVSINETFLFYVIETFDRLFQYLDRSLQAKFGSKSSRS